MSSTPVIVGVDDSLTSRVALAWAADRAAGTGAPLTLLHLSGVGAEAVPVKSTAILAGAERWVHAHHPGLATQPMTIRGDALWELLIASRTAGLLVVGRPGSHRASLVAALVRRASCPLVVVRPDRTGERRGVVAGVRGPVDEQVLRQAVRLAGTEEPLTVLRCTDDPDATRTVVDLSPLLSNPGHTRVMFRSDAQPAAARLVAASGEATAVVVGHRRRRGPAARGLHSCAERVVQRATCTVVVVPVDSAPDEPAGVT
ncbi:MAG TPA: universal stress protein [Nocardioides sp.]|uniref:universal stress protein n=1 Tax=Nocardioides sp. TaxID=35761 RepID=UPI002C17E7A6|nr:universal stress protein [Nocardioides sp.]HTW13866.1 universal stress protein [Nocardioides sp.]